MLYCNSYKNVPLEAVISAPSMLKMRKIILYHFLRVLTKPWEEGLHIFHIFKHIHVQIKRKEEKNGPPYSRSQPLKTDRGKSHFAPTMVIAQSDGKHLGYKTNGRKLHDEKDS